MIYDYIIVGSGIAGNVCAYILANAGKSCLILEKNKVRKEKICGGGIPYKALLLLSDIGMNIEKLLCLDVSVINGDISIFSDGQEEKNYYSKTCFALGSRRKVFDEFLLNEAINKGAEIIYNQNVCGYTNYGKYISVNGFMAKKVIVAIGARGFDGRYHIGQSVGISMQFKGNSGLRKDIFYYWYIEDTTKYAWLFPVGNDIWNYGIWYQIPKVEMKTVFENYKTKIIECFFGTTIEVIQKPRAEFLGNVDLRSDTDVYGVGDYAGVNNILNGGGIYRAIKQSVNLCKELI
ncbi:MAG: NAD(P)/FAD-dependent oxidoreductase [Acutalibacteraceae bacterium]|nr:NAD(P)/FAD-dependent oxidoreductase [Acutalibacteraceae bacterium]